MPQLTSTYLKEHLQSLHNATENQKFLLALSGGADSMVLADLFLKAGISFEAAHVNYHCGAKILIWINRLLKIFADSIILFFINMM
ncbi:hypothetical protein [Elizabethkingia anophelis]|uniref:hypothetical protein n=1 Tax=Elizabethkingia anophelis TaxID=1117645 RepID=UPI00300F7C42